MAIGPKRAPILNRGMKHVKSVPYKVPLRWVFYRLLQDGLYADKKGYKDWKALCAEARHEQWGEWHPNTLRDDTRSIYNQEWGYLNLDGALQTLPKVLVQALKLKTLHFLHQRAYVEIWFEARGMLGQFQYYAPPDVTLVPFGGDFTIQPKWATAKRLETSYALYKKPIKILYFGDRDKKGEEIPENAIRHIRKWCDVDFEAYWCGLTEGQAAWYDVPENFEKPGEYQWVALSDAAAREIITRAIDEHLDREIIERPNREAKELEIRLRREVFRFAKGLVKNVNVS